MASGLPWQTVFQPWSMSHLRSHRGFNPRYFTWGATLLPQSWPEHGFIVMRAYRLLSAPAKLSNLTHSYGQNITVLSRQPTDSKVSALAKVCILATVAMAKTWLLRQEHLQTTPVCTGGLTQRYHSLARKAHSPRVHTEKSPNYSTLPHEELRRITFSVLARRNTTSNNF